MQGILVLIYLAVFSFFGWLGAFCVNFTLLHTLHKTIPMFWAFLVAILTGDLAVPVAIVVKVLMILGIIAG